MKKIYQLIFFILVGSLIPIKAEWEKVYGTNTNSTIVYDLLVNEGKIFAATNGSLLYSTNNGETWDRTTADGMGFASLESGGGRIFTGIVFSFGGSTLLYSDDNGETWNNTNVTQSQISDICYVNDNLMFAFSNFQKTYKSTDHGETWEELTGLPTTDTSPIYYTSSGRLFMHNYYSDDLGASWTLIESNGAIGANQYYQDGNNLWIAGGSLYLSTDNGVNFEEKHGQNAKSVLAFGDYVFQGSDGFYHSSDGGINFVEYNQGIENVDDILDIVYDGEYLIIGLDGPGIYRKKASDFGLATSVEENKLLVNDFSLKQNYPNPFNPSTSIEYSVMSNEFVTLKVYDVLGNEISTLVNEQKNTGNYKVNFDASSLTSGIYIYRLSAGNNILSRKMMLMK